jgi:uncharacterized protein (TIGR03083 family)
MSTLAVEGLRAERAAILEVLHSLSEDEWNRPSDCAGWTVRDVVAHMGSVYHGVVDPSKMPDTSGPDPEGAMEAPVAERRTWPVAEVLAEYETFSEQAINVFAMAQDEPLASTQLPMGAFGTHPMSMLAGTFTFDAYCHLRNDILAPNGPIDRPEPPRDEQRLQPTVEWMLAGLPWMCAADLAVVDRPLVLVLDGPGGGTWTLAPGGPEGRIDVREGADAAAAATATSTTHDFVIWGTKRRPWRDYVKVDGDAAYASRVLDAVNVI